MSTTHTPQTEEPGPQATPTSPPKGVYTIVDRGNGRKLWLGIGLAFINGDGSLDVRLDALPCNGQMHIREARE